jgi:hypothetical protein
LKIRKGRVLEVIPWPHYHGFMYYCEDEQNRRYAVHSNDRLFLSHDDATLALSTPISRDKIFSVDQILFSALETGGVATFRVTDVQEYGEGKFIYFTRNVHNHNFAHFSSDNVWIFHTMELASRYQAIKSFEINFVRGKLLECTEEMMTPPSPGSVMTPIWPNEISDMEDEATEIYHEINSCMSISALCSAAEELENKRPRRARNPPIRFKPK